MAKLILEFQHQSSRSSPSSHQHVYATPPPAPEGVEIQNNLQNSQGGMFNTSIDNNSQGGSGTIAGGGGSLSSKTESNTVVENFDDQPRSRSNSWKSLNHNNVKTRSQTSLISSKTGGSYILVNKDSDDEDDEHNEGLASSEDNLSHDSYDLLEREIRDDIIKNDNEDFEDLSKQQEIMRLVDDNQAGSRKGSNQFEKEFYRQAANKAENRSPKQVQKHSGGDQATNSSSSKMSSRCSLNSSSMLSPIPPETQQKHITIVQPSEDSAKIDTRSTEEEKKELDAKSQHLKRVSSQDSFSQASNHNVPILSPQSMLQQQVGVQKGILEPEILFDDFHGHEVQLQCVPQTPEERMMVDIVRKRGGMMMKASHPPHPRHPHMYQRPCSSATFSSSISATANVSHASPTSALLSRISTTTASFFTEANAILFL